LERPTEAIPSPLRISPFRLTVPLELCVVFPVAEAVTVPTPIEMVFPSVEIDTAPVALRELTAGALMVMVAALPAPAVV
jgi:hypothetical protein